MTASYLLYDSLQTRLMKISAITINTQHNYKYVIIFLIYTSLDENPCSVNPCVQGTCVSSGNGGYTCTCNTGYYGTNCG